MIVNRLSPFSSVLYLNEDFVGGNFLFADPDKSIKAELPPKPGRLVAFYNGIDNLHGVKAVTSGRRCALAMWYTMDPAEHEKGQENHVTARNILTTLKLNAKKKVIPTTTLQQQQPIYHKTTTKTTTNLSQNKNKNNNNQSITKQQQKQQPNYCKRTTTNQKQLIKNN